MRRTCTYRSAVGTQTRVLHVGIGQQCPQSFPATDPNFSIPPTARLDTSTMSEDGRDCVYTQGTRRWTITLKPEQNCPLNAGMAEQAVTAARIPDDDDDDQ